MKEITQCCHLPSGPGTLCCCYGDAPIPTRSRICRNEPRPLKMSPSETGDSEGHHLKKNTPVIMTKVSH